jgi:hypothetical protein
MTGKSWVSVTRFISLALAIFTLGGCVSDPNNLNKERLKYC